VADEGRKYETYVSPDGRNQRGRERHGETMTNGAVLLRSDNEWGWKPCASSGRMVQSDMSEISCNLPEFVPA